MHEPHRSTYTWQEVVGTCLVGMVFVGLFGPFFTCSREAARRASCDNNLRQFGIAILNYEQFHKRLPYGWGGPAVWSRPSDGPTFAGDFDPLNTVSPIGRWSGFVALLPHLDSSEAQRQIDAEMAQWNGHRGEQTVPPWSCRERTLSMARCPSDPGPIDHSTASRAPNERINYAFCYGDTGIHATNGRYDKANRGMFQGRYHRQFKDVTDGLTNTISVGEIATSWSKRLGRGEGNGLIYGGVLTNVVQLASNPKTCAATVRYKSYLDKYANDIESWRGLHWSDGAASMTGFNTILPPNGPSCMSSSNESDWGYFSASSCHPNGVNIAFLDGSVRRISNTIDVGDQTAPAPVGLGGIGSKGPSVYGTWGAMGTYNSGESFAPDTIQE